MRPVLAVFALALGCSEPFDPCREVPLFLADMGVRDPEVDFEYDLECGRLRAIAVGEAEPLPGASEACAAALVEHFGRAAVEGSTVAAATPEDRALLEAATRYAEAYNRLLAGELPAELRGVCDGGAPSAPDPGSPGGSP